MPCSCMAICWPRNGTLFVSSTWRISRQVLGSGTFQVIGTPSSLSAATGLGPRASTETLLREATNCSRGQKGSIARARARVPTPVRKITRLISPLRRAAAKRATSSLLWAGTSLTAGATMGRPPQFSIRDAISFERRLSKDSTVRPAKPLAARLWLNAEVPSMRAILALPRGVHRRRIYLWPSVFGARSGREIGGARSAGDLVAGYLEAVEVAQGSDRDLFRLKKFVG